jgi:hypothetical protein
MPKKKLFGNTIQPACAHCRFGKLAPDRVMILCRRHGPVAPYYDCVRYRYNPLKRIPKRQPVLPQYSADDFKL